jgi:YidC/Oxa1 family membrane protein insertase
LVPLSIQQSKSTEYMKALKPYMADIREKFKGNEDAQNRAISKLYEDAKQNPLAGCFVSLAQLPVFLGLYRGVRLLALDGDLTEPFLWIPSLQGPVSGPDYRGMEWLLKGWTAGIDGGLPVPSLGWETTIGFLIMPLVLVLLQTVTMRTLQPPPDENSSQEERETMEKSQKFLKFLPLLIGFFSLQVPAGLTIYWFTSNLFTLSQSLAVKAYFAANPPEIELPEYWNSALGDDDANLSPADRRKAAEAGIRTGPSFEDMVDESRFHCLVERKPVRGESAAWQRAQASSHAIPSEMESWVKNLEPVASEATVV